MAMNTITFAGAVRHVAQRLLGREGEASPHPFPPSLRLHPTHPHARHWRSPAHVAKVKDEGQGHVAGQQDRSVGVVRCGLSAD